MQLTHNFNINSNNSIHSLCLISNNLYNQANYIVKKELNENKRWIRYNELDKIMKETKTLEGLINYRLLKSHTSQQILKLLDKDWTSYFKSLKLYKKDHSKFKSCPRPPRFKKRNSENILIYTNQICQIKNGFLILSKELKIYIPQFEMYRDRIKNFQQIRIIPKKNFYKVEIIYNYECKNINLDYEKFGSIDLGLNNLVTLVSNSSNPLIYNGRICKSINQYYNKEISRLKSIRDNNKVKGEIRLWNNSKISKLTEYRNNFIKDQFHKISRHIVNYLVDNKIGTLVVGINKGWKDSITLGKKTNQNFVSLPHSRLISYLKYKCQMVGIKVIETEEAHTSKCDSLALEQVCHQEKYLGKRVKRGLFQSSIGKLINADVNGALNIMRKVVDDCSYIESIINSGFLFNPVKVRVV